MGVDDSHDIPSDAPRVTSPSWDRLAEVFEQALLLPEARRAAFLGSLSPPLDEVSRTELGAMLAASGSDHVLAIERRLIAPDGAGGGAIESELLPAGTRVGAWEIEAFVGQGGMGEVYRASRADGEYRHVAALKVLRADVRGIEAVRRFRTERALLARLAHPNIAAIIDGGSTTEGRPFLVMSFVDGVPITTFADARDSTLEDRLRLVITIASAVHHAHVRLVVHRDIKPSNILVTADAQPILLDFGIAKLLDTTDDSDRTETGMRVLTPEHAAPEQVRGDGVSTATDVYGLGVLLYELIAGVRPFQRAGRSPAAFEHAICELEPEAPSVAAARNVRLARMAQGARGDLDRIVLMALRKQPDRRYGSAEQLADDLRRWLERRPVRAQRDTWSYRTRQFVRRNTRAVVVGVAGSALALSAGITAAVQARARAAERDRARAEQARAEDIVKMFTDLLRLSDPRTLPGGDTLRVQSFLARADEEIERLSEQPERYLSLRRVMADVRRNRGESAEAEALLAAALARSTPRLGDGNPEVLRARHAMARVLAAFRGRQRARPLFDSVRTALRRVSFPIPDLEAEVLIDLATLADDNVQAQALLDTAVELRAHTHGRDSLTTAATLDAQGEQHFNRGEFSEAATLFRAALRILDDQLPRDHVQRLSSLGNLAAAENALAHWDVAEKLATEILAVARLAGTGAEGVARSLEELAVIHANLGRFAQAEREERESIETLRTRKSTTHELLDNSRRNLAIILGASGREAEGIALLDSVRVNRLAAGDSLVAAYIGAQRVPMLLRLGRRAEAWQAVQLLLTLVPSLAPTSRMRGDGAMYAGLALLAANDGSRAALQLETATREFDKRYPAQHPRRAMAHCALGVALLQMGRNAEAHAELQPACAIHEAWGLADPLVVQWGRRGLQGR